MTQPKINYIVYPDEEEAWAKKHPFCPVRRELSRTGAGGERLPWMDVKRSIYDLSRVCNAIRSYPS
jgi:hypothetical protein